jgi:hypothetical protein
MNHRAAIASLERGRNRARHLRQPRIDARPLWVDSQIVEANRAR